MNWFEVDKNGLSKLLERRGKAFILLELLQNAWDSGGTKVQVTLTKPAGSRLALLTVEDDDPDGFADRLDHTFTLFAESNKKGDPEKRGRFNLGEKLVLALCDEAEVISTRGGVRFDQSGRHRLRRRREIGSLFSARLRLTQEEFAECCDIMQRLIPPGKIVTTFNGAVIPNRTPMHAFEATLPTDIADNEGRLRRVQRQTDVWVYEAMSGEVPTLYEMGIPVVTLGDKWHVDVCQKVPLNTDRDNVPPSFLRTLRMYVLNAMHAKLTADDANAPWVRDAAGDERCADEAVRAVVTLRYGTKSVAYDPSDPEANKLAVSEGYTVIHGGHLSGPEWENVRRAGVLLPAGQVTPSPKPYGPDGDPLRYIARNQWSDAMRTTVEYIERVARVLIGTGIRVDIVDEKGWPFEATYGGGHLVLNLGRLGHAWFEAGIGIPVNQLLIHELGHHYAMDHLSAAYHSALCTLGARLARAALEQPELFNP